MFQQQGVIGLKKRRNKMEFNKDNWVQIKQNQYRHLKINDPKNFHSYTARVKHKYFKLKEDYSNKNLSKVIEVLKEKLKIVEWEINLLKQQAEEIEDSLNSSSDINIYLDLTKSKFKFKEKPKVIILDDNPLSIACYLEEHPDIAEELNKRS